MVVGTQGEGRGGVEARKPRCTVCQGFVVVVDVLLVTMVSSSAKELPGGQTGEASRSGQDGLDGKGGGHEWCCKGGLVRRDKKVLIRWYIFNLISGTFVNCCKASLPTFQRLSSLNSFL